MKKYTWVGVFKPTKKKIVFVVEMSFDIQDVLSHLMGFSKHVRVV